MTLERKISSVFKLDENTWMKHANPWSVITRNTVLPILIIAFWSRIWLGWWALIPILIALIWVFVNPRVFSKPKSTNNWASKAVLGERVWRNRNKIAVPDHHKLMPNILSIISAIGGILVIYGVFQYHLWVTLLGSVLIYAGKLWFLDRMVWLFENMKQVPKYKKWLY